MYTSSINVLCEYHYVRRAQVIVEERRRVQLERVQVSHAAANVKRPPERAVRSVELSVGGGGEVAMEHVEERAEAHARRHHRERRPLVHDRQHRQHVRVVHHAQAPASAPVLIDTGTGRMHKLHAPEHHTNQSCTMLCSPVHLHKESRVHIKK